MGSLPISSATLVRALAFIYILFEHPLGRLSLCKSLVPGPNRQRIDGSGHLNIAREISLQICCGVNFPTSRRKAKIPAITYTKGLFRLVNVYQTGGRLLTLSTEVSKSPCVTI